MKLKDSFTLKIEVNMIKLHKATSEIHPFLNNNVLKIAIDQCGISFLIYRLKVLVSK